MSSSLMIRLQNLLCSFSNTGVDGAWPPESRGIETERFSKARSLSSHHIKAKYIVGLKITWRLFQQ